ncbi:MAG: hypothetical protein Q7J57_10820 [Gemmobacter sp.]|nr:hypothetical protein [Gemmobacter sp.]
MAKGQMRSNKEVKKPKKDKTKTAAPATFSKGISGNSGGTLGTGTTKPSK